MLANLLIVLPIFALILTGWVARRSGALGPNATREVNRVVVYLALPALLFDIMAKADPAQIWQPGFILAFGAGCLVVFAGTVLLRKWQGTALADAAIDGLNAGYANTGFIGFPLIAAVIGQDALGVTLVATIITACVLFAIAIVLIEVSTMEAARPSQIVFQTVLKLVKNPLLIAPVLGLVFMAGHLPMPHALDTYLKLMGGAASPCALIALGLFLAENAGRAPKAGKPMQMTLVLLKLVSQPLVTWIIAVPLLHLPLPMASAAVILAALPTGTGPFMLAEFYGREALLTGRVVLISTVLSIVTLSACLALF
ncbi:AEC family transporter [Thioclava sp. GXIMD4216]|uniref:AEC family transporter n=1 Tax=unclassified Thioclava TaxID=2621713 RepID=UPI0030D3B9A1